MDDNDDYQPIDPVTATDSDVRDAFIRLVRKNWTIAQVTQAKIRETRAARDYTQHVLWLRSAPTRAEITGTEVTDTEITP